MGVNRLKKLKQHDEVTKRYFQFIRYYVATAQ